MQTLLKKYNAFYQKNAKNGHSFPKTLDGARVVYYTPEKHYGEIYDANGEAVGSIRYFAICEYSDYLGRYYLFGCDENYEVVDDTLWDSIDECMKAADSSCNENISWIKAE